jgi:hypothetical protein
MVKPHFCTGHYFNILFKELGFSCHHHCIKKIITFLPIIIKGNENERLKFIILLGPFEVSVGISSPNSNDMCTPFE